MDPISVFDMLKIGVGPSSSHTLGPWRAIQRWLRESLPDDPGISVTDVAIDLYGSLALTGHGHATDKAICLGLLGSDPETIPVASIQSTLDELAESERVVLPNGVAITFDPLTQIRLHKATSLPFHANGMTCRAIVDDVPTEVTFYSTGGGFVVREDEIDGVSLHDETLPYPCNTARELLLHCIHEDASIADIVRRNELVWREDTVIDRDLQRLWKTMRDSIFRGCETTGTLPGGLGVRRRARGIAERLIGLEEHERLMQSDADAWVAAIRSRRWDFREVLRWISCFALAVNEENACMGRIVTAPTNGAAGVIPAVLMHFVCFSDEEVTDDTIHRFLLVAGEIGALFKKNATISAAEGGCQAEIGVSSAMAAAALTEVRGGTSGQAQMAAEIAMEHHLGMTCDPVAGLVQVPCIERNSMGAIKAIQAAELALVSDPGLAKVSLDEVISIMWETAKDMNNKYKETSQGGLAVRIDVSIPEC